MKPVMLTAVALALLIPAASTEENLVVNPSFEDKGSWSAPPRFIVEEPTHTGKRSLKLSSTRPVVYKGKKRDWVTVGVLGTKIPAKAGEKYVVSCWILIPKKFAETKRGAIVNIALADSKGKRKRKLLFLLEDNIQTDGWKKVEKEFTIPEGYDTMQVRFGVAGVGTAYFDDVSLVKR